MQQILKERWQELLTTQNPVRKQELVEYLKWEMEDTKANIERFNWDDVLNEIRQSQTNKFNSILHILIQRNHLDQIHDRYNIVTS